jgi:hypothetical protein
MVVEGLARFVRENGLASIRDIIGVAQRTSSREPEMEERE